MSFIKTSELQHKRINVQLCKQVSYNHALFGKKINNLTTTTTTVPACSKSGRLWSESLSNNLECIWTDTAPMDTCNTVSANCQKNCMCMWSSNAQHGSAIH